MKKNIFLVVVIMTTLSCGKTQNPNDSFYFKSSDNQVTEAKLLFYQFALENNLQYFDRQTGNETHIHGNVYVARKDGLKIYLVGSPNTKWSVHVHCHEACEGWEPTFSKVKVLFSQHFVIQSQVPGA